jgi:hypothetical protein
LKFEREKLYNDNISKMSKTKSKVIIPQQEAKEINTVDDIEKQKLLLCEKKVLEPMSDSKITDMCEKKLSITDIYGELKKLDIIGVKGIGSKSVFKTNMGKALTLKVGDRYKFVGIPSSYGPNLLLSKHGIPGDYKDTTTSSSPIWISTKSKTPSKTPSPKTKSKTPSPKTPSPKTPSPKKNDIMEVAEIYFKHIGHVDKKTLETKRATTRATCKNINLGVFIYFKDPKYPDKLLEFKYELQTNENGLYPKFSNNTTKTFEEFINQFSLYTGKITGGTNKNTNKTQRNKNTNTNTNKIQRNKNTNTNKTQRNKNTNTNKTQRNKNTNTNKTQRNKNTNTNTNKTQTNTQMSPNTKEFKKQKAKYLQEAINTNRLFGIYVTPEKKEDHQFVVHQNPSTPGTPNVGLRI